MEESGWIRRGMFVAGLGAAQFAMPAAVDLLRSLRDIPSQPDSVHLAASDPANPYGSVLPWLPASDVPSESIRPHSMARSAGANVVVVNGQLAAFFRRQNPSFRVFLPEDEPERTQIGRALAKRLAEVAIARQSRRHAMLIGDINEVPAREHFLGRLLQEAGFVETAVGFRMRRVITAIPATISPDNEDELEDEAREESA